MGKVGDIVRLAVPAPANLIKIGPHRVVIHRQLALDTLLHIAGEHEDLTLVLNPAVDGVQLTLVDQFPSALGTLPTILIEITYDVVAELEVLHHKLRHVVNRLQHGLLPLLVAVLGLRCRTFFLLLDGFSFRFHPLQVTLHLFQSLQEQILLLLLCVNILRMSPHLFRKIVKYSHSINVLTLQR